MMNKTLLTMACGAALGIAQTASATIQIDPSGNGSIGGSFLVTSASSDATRARARAPARRTPTAR